MVCEADEVSIIRARRWARQFRIAYNVIQARSCPGFVESGAGCSGALCHAEEAVWEGHWAIPGKWGSVESLWKLHNGV